MKYELSQKAYEIDFRKIEEGYLYSPMITYAKTRNKAKSQLLNDAYCENVCLTGSDDEVTYITIPVVRCKESDKYHFEEKEMTLYDIEKELKERSRLSEFDRILKDKGISHCYIRKGNYYRPNSCGYTDFKHRAGTYTKEEAVSHAKSCRDIDLEIIDIVNHNNMINEEIDNLKTRLIKT